MRSEYFKKYTKFVYIPFNYRNEKKSKNYNSSLGPPRVTMKIIYTNFTIFQDKFIRILLHIYLINGRCDLLMSRMRYIAYTPLVCKSIEFQSLGCLGSKYAMGYIMASNAEVWASLEKRPSNAPEKAFTLPNYYALSSYLHVQLYQTLIDTDISKNTSIVNITLGYYF